MRTAASLLAAILCAFLLSAAVCAEDASYSLNSLDPSEWRGAEIVKDEEHGVISAVNAELTCSYVEFPADECRSALFYCDAGGYQNENGGTVAIQFIGGGDDVLFGNEIIVICDGSFRRYSFGSEALYAEMPNGTEKVRVTLSSDGKAPYFRNMTLRLSKTAARTPTEELGWEVSGKLGLVQVKVSRPQYLILVGFVFLVALTMFAVRKILDKTKTGLK